MRRSTVLIASLALLLTACRRDSREGAPNTPAPSSSVQPADSGSIADHAEVYRRAFWRQPTDLDRILHAERRITASTDGREVEGWQWFIHLQPDPALLATLRNPESFGLLPVASNVAPRPWPVTSAPAPAWFPPAVASPDFDILQAPSAGLTVLYRASDNTLFATDSGSGFTAPVR